MKTVIISDLHGCHDAMLRLLKKAELNTTEDQLIILGDMIDRGRYSYEVIQEVMHLKETMGERCIVLFGNHEIMMMDAVGSFPLREDMQLWKQNGGGKTIQSCYRHKTRPISMLPFISKLRLYYETEQFICVHAGVGAGGVEHSTKDEIVWDRSVMEDGWYRGKLLICGHTPLKEALYQDGCGNKEILQQSKEYTLPEMGSICIDTGGVFGYKFTALVIEGNTMQVKQVFWESAA